MFRVFYTHKKLGRYCIRTYQDTPLSSIISEVSAELSKPKFHNTSCEILDDTDKAVWQYQPIKKTTKKEKKMSEKQFSQYLVDIMLNNGVDCCIICVNGCDNQLCDNCDTLDNKVCYKGIREYAEKKKGDKNNG